VKGVWANENALGEGGAHWSPKVVPFLAVTDREAATIDAPAFRRVFVGRTNDFFQEPIYRLVPNKREDYRNFQSHVHKEIRDGPVPSLAFATVIYHRHCAACTQNLRIRMRIDAIREHQVRRARARQSKPQEPSTDTPKGQLL
jgi:hypothetical protein